MMLIDDFLPHWDAAAIQSVLVEAPLDVTYDAIRETDLTDPMISALFAIRELPDRLVRRWRGTPPPARRSRTTFADLGTPEVGWVPLAAAPGTEFVVGAVGRFWRSDYGWQRAAAAVV